MIEKIYWINESAYSITGTEWTVIIVVVKGGGPLNLPYINMEKTGENIKRLMQEKGFTVADFQEIFHFKNEVSIYKWRNGSSLPSIDNLVILSYLFETTINDILVLDHAKDVAA